MTASLQATYFRYQPTDASSNVPRELHSAAPVDSVFLDLPDRLSANPMSSHHLLPTLFLLFSTFAGQAALAGPRSVPAHSNKATKQLIEAASREYEHGRLDQAASTLERALQIQPGNPATLHYLGVLRLEQGQYDQAEVLAVRSNLRVGSNIALRNRNYQLIRAAQAARRSGSVPVVAKDL